MNSKEAIMDDEKLTQAVTKILLDCNVYEYLPEYETHRLLDYLRLLCKKLLTEKSIYFTDS
jgi:hypothetical protein